MRIFQVITASEFGGAQTIVANLAQEMSEKHEVFILSGGNGDAWKHLDKKIHFIKLNDHRRNVSIWDILLLFKLFWLRLKYRPDIVHLHSSKMGAIGRIVFSPKKIVYTMHGFDSVRKVFRKFMLVEKLLKKRQAYFIGISKYDINNLKLEGISRNLHLIYNGVIDYTKESDLCTLPQFVSTLQSIRDHYPKVVMCIARISKQKKFNLFLDIAKYRPDYAFVWIGNKNKIENLPTNVYCLGEAHSAHQYLKYADLFILPTNYEGLPMSILEALSYSVPVVASAVGGVSEMLNGKNGFAVDNIVSDFAEKIDIILSEALHEYFKKEARRSYLDSFTIDNMVDSYVSLYENIYNKEH